MRMRTMKSMRRPVSHKEREALARSTHGKGRYDQREGSFRIEKHEDYYYTVSGWIDEFSTWKKKLQKLLDAEPDVRIELKVGA